MIFDYFDKAFVINLDERRDRLSSVTTRLERLNIPFERFSGIKPMIPDGYSSVGYHGSTLSHLNLWKKIKADGLKRVLIFEDDVMLRDDVAARMKEVIPCLDKMDWDIIYLGLMLITRSEATPCPHLAAFKYGVHLHAYAVNNISVLKLIEAVEKDRTRKHRQVTDFVITQIPRLNKFHTIPLLGIQGVSDSDTGGARSRLHEYFPKFSIDEFMDNCEDLRNEATS